MAHEDLRAWSDVLFTHAGLLGQTNRVMTLQFMALCLVAMSALVLTNIAKDPTLEGFYQVSGLPALSGRISL